MNAMERFYTWVNARERCKRHGPNVSAKEEKQLLHLHYYKQKDNEFFHYYKQKD